MAALNGLIDQDLGAVAAGTAKPPQVDIVSGATVTVLVMGDSVVRSAVKLIRSGRLSGATSAGAAPAAAKRALDPGEDRGARLAEPDRRRLGPQPAAHRRRGQPGVRRTRASRLPPGIRRARTPRIASSSSTSRRSPCRRSAAACSATPPMSGWPRSSRPGRPHCSSPATAPIPSRARLTSAAASSTGSSSSRTARASRFRDRNHTRLNGIAAAGAPRLREVGLFVVPDDFAFDVTEPFDAAAPRPARHRGPRQGDDPLRPRLHAARGLPAARASRPGRRRSRAAPAPAGLADEDAGPPLWVSDLADEPRADRRHGRRARSCLPRSSSSRTSSPAARGC